MATFAASYVAMASQVLTPTLALPLVANSALSGGEFDLTALVTDHLPYVIGIFVAILALCWITAKIKATARGKRV